MSGILREIRYRKPGYNTFSAEFSLNRKGTYKIDIDSAEDVNFKYVLKFEDRDVVIENGKVVE